MEKKKAFKVCSKDIAPGVAPLHENSNSWELVINNDIAFYITEIRPGGAALKAVHPDADHVFYYISGYGYQIVDGERFDFGPNDCIFVPRGADHEMYVTGNETARMIVTFSPLPAAKKKSLEEKK
jgi:mannose-6-phosphate isomerase-like protein (cupin superfamily)